MAEMATWTETLKDCPPEQKGGVMRAFTWIECVAPPPPHPTDPAFLCMKFLIEGDWQEPRESFLYLTEDSKLSDDASKARRIPKVWQYDKALKAELRAKSIEGVDSIRALLVSTGIPKNMIRSNP